MSSRVAMVLRTFGLACIVAACAAARTPSPATSASVQQTAAAATTTPSATGPVATYPPLPSPSPLPAATAAGTLSSIKASRLTVFLPRELSAAGDTVWAQANTLYARFSASTNQADLFTPEIGGEVDDLFATATGVWLADFGNSTVVRLDPTTGEVAARIPVGSAASLIAVDGTIWVTNHHEGSVSRIDPATNAVIDTIMIGRGGSDGPQQLTEGGGSVWVGESNTQSVVRMDPTTGQVIAHITVPQGFQACGGLLATDTAVWITGCHEVPLIVRIDPATNKVVTTISLDAYGQDPELINGAVWVAVAGMGSTHELERINLKTNKVDRKIDVPGLGDVAGSAIAGGDLWVSNAGDAIFRIPLAELGGG